jgi:hypothetical protein
MAGPNEAILEPRGVGQISEKFYVPAYQRGYRWGADEVGQLLDDIWESRDQRYYLQPVVVKCHGDEWELVDGQQRLTTLYLLYQYMHTEGLKNVAPKFSMRYETRANSAAYLSELDPDRAKDNIDFFHIFEAYRCIADWFEKHEHDAQYLADKIYVALVEHVNVIWYEAPDELDATELFTRLNVGRIPLTDAELVKALLLSRSRGKPGAADRSHAIAAQWDTIEQDLREPELWAFITGKATEDPTHISLLLDTIAGGPKGRERPKFHTFETLRPQIIEDPQRFWDKVVGLHALVQGWYDDRDHFHKIGFLIAQRRSLDALVKLAADKRKSEFEAELDAAIATILGFSEDDLRGVTFASAKAGLVLLLMNVETIRQRRSSSERYSFREHAAGQWSLEHIHAQSAEKLTTAEEWKEWLRLHRDAVALLDDADDIDPATKQSVIDRVNAVLAQAAITKADFDPLENELVQLLSRTGEVIDDIDSISNLALLAGSDNSVLNNSVFAVKRAEILRLDHDGSYIPVCTRNVFLKYYTPAPEQQLYFWSSLDRTRYLDAAVRVLEPYLTVVGDPA